MAMWNGEMLDELKNHLSKTGNNGVGAEPNPDSEPEKIQVTEIVTEIIESDDQKGSNEAPSKNEADYNTAFKSNEKTTPSRAFEGLFKNQNTKFGGNMENNSKSSILSMSLIDASLNTDSDIAKVYEGLNKYIEESRLEEKLNAKIKTILVSNTKDYPNVGNLFLTTILTVAISDGVALTFPSVFPQSQNEDSTIQNIMDYDERIRNEISNTRGSSNKMQKNFYTPDIIVDSKFKEICKEHVRREVSGEVKVVLLPPFILSNQESLKEAEDRRIAINKIAAASLNSLYTTLAVNIRKETRDVVVSDLFSNGNKMSLELNIHHPDFSVKDLAGNTHRANFQICGSCTSDRQENDQSWNQSGTIKKLLITSGYVDAIPYTEKVNLGFQNFKNMVRLMPNVVVTDIAMKTPTLNMFLLGLINSTILLDKSASLMVFKNNIKSKNDPSGFDHICDISAEVSNGMLQQGGKGEKVRIDLKDKKLSDEAINGILTEMFSGPAMLSLDIIPYNSCSNAEHTILKAAISSNQNDQIHAINDIIGSADVLTNGAFSNIFNPNKGMIRSEDIFANVTWFPAGVFYSGSEVHDLREIDLSVIANTCVGAKSGYVFRWTQADIAYGKDGREDCILEKLDILNKGIELSSNAFVTSRGYRVTFTSDFISALTKAVQENGLDYKFSTNTLDLKTSTGYEQVAEMYAGAGFKQNPGFIRNTGYNSNGRRSLFSSKLGLWD